MKKWSKIFIRKENGFTLIEVLISEALIGIIVIALLAALGNAYKLSALTNARETAKNYAEYAMQYVKNESWSSSYSPVASPIDPDTGKTIYSGFSATPTATTLQYTGSQPTEQLINIVVTGPNITYTLSGYKVNY